MNPQEQAQHNGAHKTPLFFREEYAGFIVKGNFMTLSAKPQYIEEGEWLAHQVVEQHRLLGLMVKCVSDGASGRSVCTEQSCPKMTAGPGITWAWMDTNRNAIEIPAPMYIRNIQVWVAGKIHNHQLFPTDHFAVPPPLPDSQQVASDPNHWLGKTSGFPQRFENDIKVIYTHMLRCYAHLYWDHWLFFWDQDAHKNLNTCFIHFVNVGRLYGLLNERDLEMMQGLIDIWVRRKDLPPVLNGAAAPASASAGAGAKTVATATAPPHAGSGPNVTAAAAATGPAAPTA